MPGVSHGRQHWLMRCLPGEVHSSRAELRLSGRRPRPFAPEHLGFASLVRCRRRCLRTAAIVAVAAGVLALHVVPSHGFQSVTLRASVRLPPPLHAAVPVPEIICASSRLSFRAGKDVKSNGKSD